MHDASALGIRGGGDAEMDAGWQLVEQVVKDPAGVERLRPAPLTEFSLVGSGYPLTSYRPTLESRRQQFVAWAFTPAIDKNSPAVAEVIKAAKQDMDMFPVRPLDTTMGQASWSWSQMPAIKQKLVTQAKFDPGLNLFRRGAHMPLMIYVGNPASTRRKPEAKMRREERATLRGWGRKAREAKGKGKNCGAKGDGAPDPRGSGWTKGHEKGSETGGKEGSKKGGQENNDWAEGDDGGAVSQAASSAVAGGRWDGSEWSEWEWGGSGWSGWRCAW